MRKWFKKPPPTPESYLKGSNRATTTLCQLMASEMLRNLDVKLKEKYPEGGDGSYRSMRYETVRGYIEFPSFRLEIHRLYDVDTWRFYSVSFKNNHYISFDEIEKKFLQDTFVKFLDLQKKSVELRREAENQQKAVDAIALFLGCQEENDVKGNLLDTHSECFS